MSDKKYTVLEEMIKAACVAVHPTLGQMTMLGEGIKAALLWLGPELKTMFAVKLYSMRTTGNSYHVSIGQFNEIADSLFLPPEPEVPKEIKDLLWMPAGKLPEMQDVAKAHDAALLEAFRRGQRYRSPDTYHTATS